MVTFRCGAMCWLGYAFLVGGKMGAANRIPTCQGGYAPVGSLKKEENPMSDGTDALMEAGEDAPSKARSGSETRRRKSVIGFRPQPHEWDAGMVEAEKYGISIHDLARAKFLQSMNLPIPTSRKQHMPSEQVRALSEVSRALVKAGVNINTCARQVHTWVQGSGHTQGPAIEDVLSALREVEAVIVQINDRLPT